MVQNIVIKNKTTGEEVIMDDGTNSKFVLDKIDWDCPNIKINKYKIPMQIGETMSSVSVGTRKPCIKGNIISKAKGKLGMKWSEYYEEQKQEINSLKQRLDKLINIYSELVIEVAGCELFCVASHPPTYSANEKKNNEVICEFTLDFECLKPLFYNKKTKVIEMVTRIANFHFPLSIPTKGVVFGKIKREQDKAVTNNGDIKVGFKAKIEAVGGIVKDPTLVNLDTSEKFSLKGVQIDVGETLYINTEFGNEDCFIVDTSGNIKSCVGNTAKGSKYFQIELGTNRYGYFVEEQYRNNIDFSLSFTEQYFNIEGM